MSVDYLDAVRAKLRDIADRTGAADPATLADRIMLIIDGLLANTAVLGADGAATSAVEFAEEVVRFASQPITPRQAAPATT